MPLHSVAVYEIISDLKSQSLTALILSYNSFSSPQWNNVLHEYSDIWGDPSVLAKSIILAVCNESLVGWKNARLLCLPAFLGAGGHCELRGKKQWLSSWALHNSQNTNCRSLSFAIHLSTCKALKRNFNDSVQDLCIEFPCLKVIFLFL